MNISINQTTMSHNRNSSWGTVALPPRKLTNVEHNKVAKIETVEPPQVLYSGLDILAIYNKGLSNINKPAA